MIRCPNCGVWLKNANEMRCPNCGHILWGDPHIARQEEEAKLGKSRAIARILLIIALVITILYFRYGLQQLETSGFFERELDISDGIIAMLVLPHYLFTIIGFLINLVGALITRRALALIAAIMYTLACVTMPVYFMYVVVQAVLCYVAFAVIQKR